MKPKTLFFFFMLSASSAYSENYSESYNVISDDYTDSVQDAKIVRNINGGTVIIPEFDDSCPEVLKAPFEYACKIVEEYVPPCLPLNVRVCCGRINQRNAISKVEERCRENFGNNPLYCNSNMSMIKGVILAELGYGESVTYLDSIPDKAFLTGGDEQDRRYYDVIITYNEQRLNEMSFSLEANPGDKYDFVTLAIRDLLKSFGLSAAFRYNPIAGGIIDPEQEFKPFESVVSKALGHYGNPAARYSEATKGELPLISSGKTVKLYAPSEWSNGESLNYFVPQQDCSVSQILRHDFCKGMVERSLTDGYSSFIFRDLLGWQPNFTVSSSRPSTSAGGSTSLLMPYGGEITFSERSTYGIMSFDSCKVKRSSVMRRYEDSEKRRILYEYVNQFHPFLSDIESNHIEGTSITLLKKDGTWDIVKYVEAYLPYGTFSMNDWTLHYDNDEYARTIDGYLRARITFRNQNYSSGNIVYNSKFFVVDYVPQRISMSYDFTDEPETSSLRAEPSQTTANNVRVFLKNTEGSNRIVVERLRQGFRVPSKFELYDFKKGYFDTTIDRTTTFTAIAYNDNGTTRGIPLTIVPINEVATASASEINFRIESECIYVSTQSISIGYTYRISSVDSNTQASDISGVTQGIIDISALPQGVYVLTVNNPESGHSKSFKFKK